MSAPARILVLSACLLTGAWTACRGAIVVHWLDTPLELGGWWNPPTPHSLDIDGNGTIDFSFWGDVAASVGMRSEGSNRYLIIPDLPPNIGGPVAALDEGFQIGPESSEGNLDWFNHPTDWATLMQQLSTGRSGEFWGTRAYIGFEFQIDSNTHYGWFDFQGHSSTPYGVVYGWGYESTPGVSIPAGAVAIPEPATIALLAAGGLLLALHRKHK